MPSTYKAVEVTSPGKFNLVEREVIEPKSGQVRIRVQACGVCHSDSATVSGQWPGMVYPRVPGHEAIGLVEHGNHDRQPNLAAARRHAPLRLGCSHPARHRPRSQIQHTWIFSI